MWLLCMPPQSSCYCESLSWALHRNERNICCGGCVLDLLASLLVSTVSKIKCCIVSAMFSVTTGSINGQKVFNCVLIFHAKLLNVCVFSLASPSPRLKLPKKKIEINNWPGYPDHLKNIFYLRSSFTSYLKKKQKKKGKRNHSDV